MTLLKKYYPFVLFLIVILISIFFRFWKIGIIPYGFNNDAIWEASAATEILKGNFSPYLPYAQEGWRGEGIIRLVVSSLMIFLGNNPITVPLSTAGFGVGLVIGIFFLLRRLFNWQVAILTSFFIAISGWHITFSKSGWRAVTVPFFTTLLFYFYFKGLESKKKIHFILAGTMLSVVSLYTYDAARVIPIFFAFWLLIEFLTTRSFLKTYWKLLVYLFFSCFIVSLPMIFYAIMNLQNFTSRTDFLFVGREIEKVGNLFPIINNITTSLLLFNVRANGNDFFIFAPLVDKPASWILPIGLAITCYYSIFRKDKKHFFMLGWFLASLIPGILSTPNGNRAIGSIPSVYFFAAVGILYPLKLISNLFGKYKLSIISTVFILMFCTYAMFLTYQDYLGPHRRELFGFYPETLVVTNYAKTIVNNYDIYITDRHPPELLTYYLHKEGQNNAFSRNFTYLGNSQNFLDINITSGKGLAFFMFVNPQNEFVADQLQSIHKNATKIYLWYRDDNINRPASLVILVPPKKQ